ncbi:hypothetical protein [Amycolatopsis speibonae]|uniref:Uncharacterized protein n=1 Tax=Amycolatopsis speibonae TaxID=1450224 RepID=A0ABV7PAI3_9PSEU
MPQPTRAARLPTRSTSAGVTTHRVVSSAAPGSAVCRTGRPSTDCGRVPHRYAVADHAGAGRTTPAARPGDRGVPARGSGKSSLSTASADGSRVTAGARRARPRTRNDLARRSALPKPRDPERGPSLSRLFFLDPLTGDLHRNRAELARVHVADCTIGAMCPRHPTIGAADVDHQVWLQPDSPDHRLEIYPAEGPGIR